LICSPEYAHGVPGSLKNALDWVVSSGELVNKPIALINASPRAVHAYESLAETLRTMSAIVVPEACVTVPVLGSKLDAVQLAEDSEIGPVLRGAILALAREALVRVVDRDIPPHDSTSASTAQ
jgi:NAD(P)H-dependent FMN reductase